MSQRRRELLALRRLLYDGKWQVLGLVNRRALRLRSTTVELPFKTVSFGDIVVQFQVGQMTEANMKAALAEQTKQLHEGVQLSKSLGRKGVIIVDGSVELVPPPTVRKLQAQWITENREALRATTAGMGFVVPGSLTRGAMQALFWMVSLPVPSTAHERLELALDWAIATVDGAGGEIHRELLMDGVIAIERARELLHPRGVTTQ